MGYWSTHPMGGDAPYSAFSDLIETCAKKEGMDYYDIDDYEFKVLLEKYKMDIIENPDNYVEERFRFVIPFAFIQYTVRFDDETLEKVISFLGDGGSKSRGYTKDEYGPMNHIEKVLEYKRELLSEDVDEEDSIEIIGDDIDIIIDGGLVYNICKAVENNSDDEIDIILVNKK